MRKRFLVLLILPLVFGACSDNDDLVYGYSPEEGGSNNSNNNQPEIPVIPTVNELKNTAWIRLNSDAAEIHSIDCQDEEARVLVKQYLEESEISHSLSNTHFVYRFRGEDRVSSISYMAREVDGVRIDGKYLTRNDSLFMEYPSEKVKDKIEISKDKSRLSILIDFTEDAKEVLLSSGIDPAKAGFKSAYIAEVYKEYKVGEYLEIVNPEIVVGTSDLDNTTWISSTEPNYLTTIIDCGTDKKLEKIAGVKLNRLMRRLYQETRFVRSFYGEGKGQIIEKKLGSTQTQITYHTKGNILYTKEFLFFPFEYEISKDKAQLTLTEDRTNEVAIMLMAEGVDVSNLKKALISVLYNDNSYKPGINKQ